MEKRQDHRLSSEDIGAICEAAILDQELSIAEHEKNTGRGLKVRTSIKGGEMMK